MKNKLLYNLMLIYKRYKQKKSDLSQEHVLNIAQRMLRKSPYVLLISNTAGESPGARVVQPVLEETENFFKVWIGTHTSSRKIREVKDNDQVTLVVQDNGKSAQLVLKGRASIEPDDALRKKHWQGVWRMFFPNGPTSSDYVLIQVVFDELDILSFSNNIIPEPFGLRSLNVKLGV